MWFNMMEPKFWDEGALTVPGAVYVPPTDSVQGYWHVPSKNFTMYVSDLWHGYKGITNAYILYTASYDYGSPHTIMLSDSSRTERIVDLYANDNISSNYVNVDWGTDRSRNFDLLTVSIIDSGGGYLRIEAIYLICDVDTYGYPPGFLVIPDPIVEENNKLITITAEPGTDVYYSLDGTDPLNVVHMGTLYTEPFIVNSEVVIIRAQNLLGKSSMLPANLPPKVPSTGPWYDVTSNLYWEAGADAYSDYVYNAEKDIWSDPNGDWMMQLTPFWQGYKFEKFRVTYFGGSPTYGWLGCTDIDWSNYIIDVNTDTSYSGMEFVPDWQPGFLFQLIDIYTQDPQIIYKIEVFNPNEAPPGYAPVVVTPKINIQPANSQMLPTEFNVTINTLDTVGTPIIYYTIDGTDPKTSQAQRVYTVPFTVTRGTTVLAYVVADNGESTYAMISYSSPPPYDTPVELLSILDSNSNVQNLAVSDISETNQNTLNSVITFKTLELIEIFSQFMSPDIRPIIEVVGFTKFILHASHTSNADSYIQYQLIYFDPTGKSIRSKIEFGGWHSKDVKKDYVFDTYGATHIQLVIWLGPDHLKYTLQIGRA